MKTTLFLLSLLLLSLPAKAQGGGTDPDKTFWHDQLTDVSVGSNSDSGSDDVLLSVTDNDTTYTVKTAKGLAWIAKVTNDGLFYKVDDTDNTANYPHHAGFEGCTVELDGSLTGDSLSLRDHYWTPIGDNLSKSFKGAFDGNHKLVAGLKADTTVSSGFALVGLFGSIVNTSVSNVGVWVAAEGVKGKSGSGCYAGGIAGYSANSTIRNCFVSGDAGATITGIGSCTVGGIVGQNIGVVENCYATVDVYASGSSNNDVGGIAGTNERGHSITSVYATGKVTGTSSSSCYVGGITGSNSGTLSKALALNKEELSGTPGTNGDLYLGRISGNKGIFSSFSQCYASTKITLTDNGTTRQDTYFDGTDASVATDLSLLFPTGEDGNSVWTSGGTDKLPQLSSGEAADASTGKPGQPALAKADYLEELPLGTEGNPYVIDISSVSSDNIGKNQFTYSYTDNNVTLTLLKPDSCYLIKDKAKGGSNTYTVSLNTEGADGKPYHLYAQAGCALDTLLVPAGTACIIQGDSLRSKSCQVRGGTLTMEVPVVLEMPKVSGDNYWQTSSLYIDGGSVTVNDTLRAYASGSSAYGICTPSYSSSKLTIGSKGVVYAYGKNRGCSLYSDTPAEIEAGGILRAAGGMDAIAAGNGALSFPAIEWRFYYAPDSARLTLKKDGGNEVAATFSEKVFGPYFDEAKRFAANVEGNTTYHLYAGGNTTPFNGRLMINGNSVAAFTNEFTASESKVLQSYSYVGLPMETFTTSPDSITLTNECAYKVGKADKDKHFDNVLSCEVKKLCVIWSSTVLLNGVTVIDSLLVKENGIADFYLLKPEDGAENKLGNVRVEKGRTLSLYIGGDGTLASTTTFTNSGTFTDYTGLVNQVKASIIPGDTLLVSRPSVSGTTEVTPGGTTTLTVAGVSEWQQGANNSVSPTYSYSWQEWKEGEDWKAMSGNNPSQTVGKGKYRCRVTYILTVDYESVRTALYSLPVEVTEKSAPPYIPPVYSYYTVTLPEVEGARLDKTGSHTVEEGYSFPFRLTLDADYDRSQPVVTVDRHGTETLTPEVLADGSLKYRIRDVEQDLTVSITGIVRNDDPTAAGSVPAADVRVRSFGNLLHITVPAPTSARLYDFHGRLLRTALLPAGSSTMPKPAGPCIVVLGGESFKVGD
ncbi:GLUG motif-containing protein [uncultured Parabacteroides sp.]|uniref:GLUG motif-containing protein n=1 Tax=uncultured Parabacteroides sp. TaxID=512312 RepID=UPI0025E1B479|nr:GLUG motif-containing protein [uncultured Parabacteroides sp.]